MGLDRRSFGGRPEIRRAFCLFRPWADLFRADRYWKQEALQPLDPMASKAQQRNHTHVEKVAGRQRGGGDVCNAVSGPHAAELRPPKRPRSPPDGRAVQACGLSPPGTTTTPTGGFAGRPPGTVRRAGLIGGAAVANELWPSAKGKGGRLGGAEDRRLWSGPATGVASGAMTRPAAVRLSSAPDPPADTGRVDRAGSRPVLPHSRTTPRTASAGSTKTTSVSTTNTTSATPPHPLGSRDRPVVRTRPRR